MELVHKAFVRQALFQAANISSLMVGV